MSNDQTPRVLNYQMHEEKIVKPNYESNIMNSNAKLLSESTITESDKATIVSTTATTIK